MPSRRSRTRRTDRARMSFVGLARHDLVQDHGVVLDEIGLLERDGHGSWEHPHVLEAAACATSTATVRPGTTARQSRRAARPRRWRRERRARRARGRRPGPWSSRSACGRRRRAFPRGGRSATWTRPALFGPGDGSYSRAPMSGYLPHVSSAHRPRRREVRPRRRDRGRPRAQPNLRRPRADSAARAPGFAWAGLKLVARDPAATGSAPSRMFVAWLLWQADRREEGARHRPRRRYAGRRGRVLDLERLEGRRLWASRTSGRGSKSSYPGSRGFARTSRVPVSFELLADSAFPAIGARLAKRQYDREVSRAAELGLEACAEALVDAGLVDDDLVLTGVDPHRVAVVLGSGIGGALDLETRHLRLLENARPHSTDLYWSSLTTRPSWPAGSSARRARACRRPRACASGAAATHSAQW